MSSQTGVMLDRAMGAHFLSKLKLTLEFYRCYFFCVVVAIQFVGLNSTQATVLFSQNAESGVCNTAVPDDLRGGWSATGGSFPNSLFYHRCDTPVPGTGHRNYFRADFVNLQHDSWNVHEDRNPIVLSPSRTYYLGGFFRFDRINSNDIWHDVRVGGDGPDSYDKLFDMYGSIRLIITSGWHYGYYPNGADHKFTFGSYISPTFCADRCSVNDVDANVAPYGPQNPYLCDYERWYAVVMSVKPSSGNGAQDGLIELYINGTKIFSHPGATQDSTTPTINSFQYSGTVAQPAYDVPAHYRKADSFVFADSMTDIQNLGLMKDPGSGGGPPPPRLTPPRNLQVRSQQQP